LKGSPYYRFDVGNYRVVYEVDYDARRVSILTIGDRKNVYRRY
jgi:mRNA-degrading endonuclease RelE of RelBE toxin-antitoxin system